VKIVKSAAHFHDAEVGLCAVIRNISRIQWQHADLNRSKNLYIARSVQFWICAFDHKLKAVAGLKARLVCLKSLNFSPSQNALRKNSHCIQARRLPPLLDFFREVSEKLSQNSKEDHEEPRACDAITILNAPREG
jgi:hypothetical protein